MTLLQYFRCKNGYIDMSALKHDNACRAFHNGEKLHPYVNDLIKRRIRQRITNDKASALSSLLVWCAVQFRKRRADEHSRARQSRGAQMDIRAGYSHRIKAIAYAAFMMVLFLSSANFAEASRDYTREIPSCTSVLCNPWGYIKDQLYADKWPDKTVAPFKEYVEWPVTFVSAQKNNARHHFDWRRLYMPLGIACIVLGGAVISFAIWITRSPWR